MSSFQSDRPRSKGPLLLILLLLVVGGLVAAAIVLRPRFETEAPKIALSSNADVLGAAPLDITVTDAGRGLKSVSAVLTQNGTERRIAAEQFAEPVPQKKITMVLPKVEGIKEGPAVLRVTARDASLWNSFGGNETVLEKTVTIDITPPTIELIADDRYVNFGGVGVLVYKPSADTEKSGVKMGDYFFPGFGGQVKGRPDAFIVLFAHPYNVEPSVRPTLVATDKAGNTREMRIAYELKDVRYKKSTIALSDNFLANKVAPLLTDVAARQGTPQDVFIAVNKKLRKVNEDKITEVTSKATPQMLFSDAFVQLSNSKVEANFADQRTYTYNGQPVDTAYHLGYDLSVTKNYPIEAANSGKVVFVGDNGIYGNTVIIDHGLGLFSLYGRLNSMDVKVGDSVAKRQPLGRSGETGLAAGDHLHFGIYLDGLAVLPVEWWDQKWINDNLAPKLEGRSGEEIATSQQNARIAAKKAGGGKKRR